MGAHKHRLRTTCLAVALLFLTANQAVAHQTNAQTELQEGVVSFYSDRFQGATTAGNEKYSLSSGSILIL